MEALEDGCGEPASSHLRSGLATSPLVAKPQSSDSQNNTQLTGHIDPLRSSPRGCLGGPQGRNWLILRSPRKFI